MTVIDRQKYVSELEKLLEVMSDSDRGKVLAMINACFDAGGSDDEVIGRLGSPTKAAISVLRNYKPSETAAEKTDAPAPAGDAPAPAPVEAEAASDTEKAPEPEPVIDEPAPAVDAPAPVSAPEAEKPAPAAVDEESFPDIESMLENGEAAVGEPAADDTAPVEAVPVKAAPVKAAPVKAAPVKAKAAPAAEDIEEPASKPRPLVLIPYVIGAIVVGVPVTVLLILLSLAALAAGLLVGFAAVVVVSFCFLGMTAVADVLLVAGAGLMLTALCLPLLMLAVTIFIKGVIGFIDLLLALGGRWGWTHGEE